jgi:hypothetical protein
MVLCGHYLGESHISKKTQAAQPVHVVVQDYQDEPNGGNGWLRITPWPRLFHNLRASRETKLMERFPIQVVTASLGNTPTIAPKHYLQVTEEHFHSALTGGAEAVQNPVQHASEMLRNNQNGELAGERADAEKPADFQGLPECTIPRMKLVLSPSEYRSDGEGFEPPVEFLPLQFSRLPQ